MIILLLAKGGCQPCPMPFITKGEQILEKSLDLNNVRRPGRPTTRSADAAGSSTLLTGIELLKSIGQLSEPANLSGIARRAGFSMSRTHRYLTTLVQSGMLQLDHATGLYSLGPAAIELGVAALSQTDAIQIASTVMRELTTRLSLVTVLCMWGSNGPTIVRWEQGAMEAAIRVKIGINLSLLSTAAGLIFLAFLDADQVGAQLRYDIKDWNQYAKGQNVMTLEKAEKLRAKVQRQGIACAVGLRNPMISALSAPVFNSVGLAMSLTVTGIQGSFDTNLAGEVATSLRESADKLSRLLGARLPADNGAIRARNARGRK